MMSMGNIICYGVIKRSNKQEDIFPIDVDEKK
jgi:hypothetical protein